MDGIKTDSQKLISDVIFAKIEGISDKINNANYVIGILEERVNPFLYESTEETVTGFPSDDQEYPPHDNLIDALDEILIKIDEHCKNVEKIVKRTEK
jgi:hypothetical protein